MSQLSITALTKALSIASPANTLSPGPGPGKPTSGEALKRCRAAWRRAYKATLSAQGDGSCAEFYAVKAGCEAYCNAMPILVGYEGIRDFIACAAHGILIGAIPDKKSGQLLYAAQVAISTLPHEPKTPQAPPTTLPPPPPPTENRP